MAKPWARTRIGYMRHPKFLALTGNAIALWHEGKDYCDEHHTDGLIPRDALKTFRFNGRKSIDMLMESCGQKPDGSDYAPLWERHAVGFRMHDYLDHNDCRDEVLARIGDADDIAALRKLANKKRQAKFRAERKAKLEAERNADRNAEQRDVTRTSQGPTETPTPTPTETLEREERTNTAATPRSLAREPNPNGNYRVIERIAVELLNEESFDSESDFTAAVKSLCARRAIAYGPPDEDADVVHRACASAKVKRVMSRRSMPA